MNGLFHRLAQQVVGPEPTRVHAMERLPFAPLADMQAPADEIVAPVNDRPVATTPPSTRREQEGPAGAPERKSPTTNGRRGELDWYPAQASESPDAESPRSKSANPESMEAFSLLPPAVVDDETAALPPAPQAMGRSRSYVGDRGGSTAGHAEYRLPFGIPAPIVDAPMTAPEAADQSSATRRWGAAYGEPGDRSPRPETSSADEPTEVHVHIGRIEVTATQESVPPRRKASTGRKPMSLDEYLARRQRGWT